MKCPNLDCPVRSISCERFAKKELNGAKGCAGRTTEENEKRLQILWPETATNSQNKTEAKE